VERKASQRERDAKKMRVKVEGLGKKVDGTGWSEEKEQASEEVLRRADKHATRCTQVRV
jgi:hypothetical protein